MRVREREGRERKETESERGAGGGGGGVNLPYTNLSFIGKSFMTRSLWPWH